jgi:hypothetical protein
MGKTGACHRWAVGRTVLLLGKTSGKSLDLDEVIAMPRSVREIREHGDELAKRFEDYAPRPEDERDPKAYLALRQAALTRAEAGRSVQPAVTRARTSGYSWRWIGAVIGTSGEAAHQRYGAGEA